VIQRNIKTFQLRTLAQNLFIPDLEEGYPSHAERQQVGQRHMVNLSKTTGRQQDDMLLKRIHFPVKEVNTNYSCKEMVSILAGWRGDL
jgi:hypothetical protein